MLKFRGTSSIVPSRCKYKTDLDTIVWNGLQKMMMIKFSCVPPTMTTDGIGIYSVGYIFKRIQSDLFLILQLEN